MKKTKRLFLFAGYDKDGIIDDTLVHYLTELSKLGDIVLVMDCDVADTTKLSGIKNILHTELARHNEYDFGSYKRGYIWAHDNKILDKYDWVYLVNDSVYGPLFDLEPVLCDLESRGVDLIGMTDFFDKDTPKHIQSWFVGVSRMAATSKIFYDFMCDIKHRNTKDEIVLRYEVGLSRMLLQNGYKMSAYFNQQNNGVHTVYETPVVILENFIPFIKKPALKKLRGIIDLLPYATDEVVDKIHAHAMRFDALPDPFNLLPSQYNLLPKYKQFFRFTLLSLPVITIYKKQEHDCQRVSYKVYVFDKIPLIKLSKSI